MNPPKFVYILIIKILLMDDTDTYHKDRLNTVQIIEGSLSELGNIFQQLSSLVSEQGEMITRCFFLFKKIIKMFFIELIQILNEHR